MKARGANHIRETKTGRVYYPFNQMTDVNRDLCRLVALLISDGGISPYGKASWEIYFRNRSDSLNHLFRNTIHSLYGKPPRPQSRSDGTVQQRLRSKPIGNSLLHLTNTYRTLPCLTHPICGKYRNQRKPCLKCRQKEFADVFYPVVSFPTEIENDASLSKEFLRIVFSCDGGASLYKARRGSQSWFIRKLFVDSTNPSVRSYYQMLLEKLGFQIQTYGSQIRIQKYEMFRKYCDEIGFVDGVKIGRDSKYWESTTKNELLEKIMLTYDPSSSQFP